MNEDYLLFTKAVHRIFSEAELQEEKRYLLDWATAVWLVRISGEKNSCLNSNSDGILQYSVLCELLRIIQTRSATLPSPDAMRKQFDYGRERKKRQQAQDDITFLLTQCEAFYRDKALQESTSLNRSDIEPNPTNISKTSSDKPVESSLTGKLKSESTTHLDVSEQRLLMDDF